MYVDWLEEFIFEFLPYHTHGRGGGGGGGGGGGDERGLPHISSIAMCHPESYVF